MNQLCVRCGSPLVGMVGISNPQTFSKTCIASFRCHECGNSWQSTAPSPRSQSVSKQPAELPLIAEQLRRMGRLK